MASMGMSPTRNGPGGQDGGGGSGSPGAFELDVSLCDIPMDIQPPSPKQSKKPPVRHIPFLYTSVAKKAYEETHSTNRPPRPGSASPFGGVSERRNGVISPLLSPTKKGGASLLGGRRSAEPLSSEMESRLSYVLERRSLSKSKIGGVTKKRPELFVLEAEQRALEGQQKAMEREAFERKRSEAAIHVTHLTKHYNDLKKQRIDMDRELALMHDRKAALDAEAQGEEHRTAAHNALRIQDLEAKLEYWTQALREEEAYTKTLLHMKARSASDKHGRDIETAKFKQNVKNHDHDLQMLMTRYQDAKNDRDAAEKQVSDYWDEMDMYRNRRDGRLQERKRQVGKMQAREEAMRRLQAEDEELQRQRRLADEAANAQTMKDARARDRRLAHLEEGFQKMMSLSGIQSVEELQESFLTRREREANFEKLLEENKDKINDLTDERQELDQELLKVKFSGSANDAERDEIQECQENISMVKRRTQERMMKQAGIEANLIRVRSAFEYLAIKLQEVDLEENEVDAILTKAEAKALPVSIQEEAAGGDGTGSEKSDAEVDADEIAQVDQDSDLSLEVGGQDLSQIEEGDPTVQGEAAAADQMGSKEIKMEMKKVQDPKTGVIAKLRECMAKLDKVYMMLEERAGGVEPQSRQNAEAKASGRKNLIVTLSDAKHNYRIPLTRGNATPRRGADDDDDTEDLEDRSTLKMKADRLVSRKKREEAARFDEFGNEIIPPKKDEKSKKK